jgi:hypothetical protein
MIPLKRLAVDEVNEVRNKGIKGRSEKPSIFFLFESLKQYFKF